MLYVFSDLFQSSEGAIFDMSQIDINVCIYYSETKYLITFKRTKHQLASFDLLAEKG